MSCILIGKTADGAAAALSLRLANRHGLVTGATGTGKTVTLQRLAEGFSKAGVPVFAADIKGDLSGLAQPGDGAGRFASAAQAMGLPRSPRGFPVRFWDLFGHDGMPIRTSVQAMGPLLMARLLALNDTQEGTLNIAFRHAEAIGCPLMDLGDLHDVMRAMQDDAEDVKSRYGNFTAVSIGVIQRQMLVLEGQGGGNLFGEPALDINDLLAVAEDGSGVVNLLSAETLMENPRLYGTFLLFLLTRLFDVLPEVGDMAKPKLVFFFDEAHMLFREASPRLMETIERVVRLIRSKGVGVYFVSQNPLDVPPAVLAQLGNRVQHALRAFTPKDQRLIKAVAQTFRSHDPKGLPDVIMGLGVGEALVSVLQEDGSPSHVQRVAVAPPDGHVGPVGDDVRKMLRRADPMRERYGQRLTRAAMKVAFLTKGMMPDEIDAAVAAMNAAERAAERAGTELYDELMAVNGLDKPPPPVAVRRSQPLRTGWIMPALALGVVMVLVGVFG